MLIAGGGCGGMHTAVRLDRLLRPGEGTVMLADPLPYVTYQPLDAAASSSAEGRNAARKEDDNHAYRR